MRGLIKYEYVKCAHQKSLIFLFCLALLSNLFIFRYRVTVQGPEGYSQTEIAEMYRQLSRMHFSDYDEEIHYLIRKAKDENDEKRASLYMTVQQQIQDVTSYPEYWDYIMSGGDSITVLLDRPSSFSYRNRQSIQNAYKELKNIVIVPDCQEGITAYVQSYQTDFLILVMMLYLTVLLICQEWENGYLTLFRTTQRGVYPFIRAKILFLFLCCIMLFALFWGMNYLLAGTMLGFGDLNRCIQSVFIFQACPYKISVGWFVLLFLLLKLAGYTAITSFFVFIAFFNKNIFSSVLMDCIGLTAGFLLWKLINPHSLWGALKYFNLIQLIDTPSFFSSYENVKLLERPVNRIVIGSVMWIICLSGSLIGTRIIQWNTFRLPWPVNKRLSVQKSSFSKSIFICPSAITGFEVYKLLIKCGGLLMVLSLSMLSILSLHNETLYKDQSEIQYELYCDRLNGPLSEEKEKYISNEQQNIMDETDDTENQSGSLNRIIQQYTELKERQNAGLKVSFFSQTGWLRYFEEYGKKKDAIYAGIYLFVIIFSSFRFYTIESENHMNLIFRTIDQGRRKVLRAKNISLFLFSTIALVITYVPYTIKIFHYYQMNNFSESTASLLLSESHLLYMPIGSFLLLYWTIRVIGVIVTDTVVYFTSLLSKSRTATLVLLFLILELPVLTYLSGLTDEWGILLLITGHILL